MKHLRRWRRVLGVALCGAVAVALLACSSNNNKAATANRNGGTPSAAGAKGTAAPAAANRTFAKAPTFTIDTNKGYIATLKTDEGDIVVQLNAKVAPITVNNFVFLAQQHFYDGLTCHRVVPDFVAQCGDPTGTGNGGPGYTIPDEPGPLTHITGAVAMAKTNAPNSAGSQFYIVLAPQPSLDGKYTVFGQVIQGMDVVKSLTPREPTTATAPGDRIVSITIQQTDQTPTPVPGTPVAQPRATATPTR